MSLLVLDENQPAAVMTYATPSSSSFLRRHAVEHNDSGKRIAHVVEHSLSEARSKMEAEEFVCGYCFRKFGSARGVESHIGMVHSMTKFVQQGGSFVCAKCSLSVNGKHASDHRAHPHGDDSAAGPDDKTDASDVISFAPGLDDDEHGSHTNDSGGSGSSVHSARSGSDDDTDDDAWSLPHVPDLDTVNVPEQFMYLGAQEAKRVAEREDVLGGDEDPFADPEEEAVIKFAELCIEQHVSSKLATAFLNLFGEIRDQRLPRDSRTLRKRYDKIIDERNAASKSVCVNVSLIISFAMFDTFLSSLNLVCLPPAWTYPPFLGMVIWKQDVKETRPPCRMHLFCTTQCQIV